MRALARPAAWPVPLPPDAAFEFVETHISSLLMAGDGVLKLKKPLALPFLDFSTLERRRHFCEEELRLNRRTAPALYRAVLPVLGPPDAPRLGPPDDPAAAAAAIDWAVWMRRFDAAGLYDRLARDGALTAAHVDALAAEIARFHAALPPSPPAFGAPEVLAGWVAETLAELQAEPLASQWPAATARRVQALAAWSAARAQALQPLLAARRAGGAVVEGHGDLHLGNIVWEDGRAWLFDALEFAPALRHTDRMAELAFPFMDLLDHGLPRLAWRLLSAVMDAGGDHDGLPLLRWLAAYRALVRAKVALLTAVQGGDVAALRAVAQRRVALADALAHPPARAPLVLTTGLSGSGKSTVAAMLAERLGAVRVRSDLERKRLHGVAPTARDADPAVLYGAAATRRTYDRLLAIARTALAGDVGVVLDAAYLRRDERLQARALARELGAPFAVVACEAPPEVLAARIGRRQAAGDDPSDADLAVLALQQRVAEPPGPDEPVHVLDTRGALDEVERAVEAWARAWPASTPGGPAAGR